MTAANIPTPPIAPLPVMPTVGDTASNVETEKLFKPFGEKIVAILRAGVSLTRAGPQFEIRAHYTDGAETEDVLIATFRLSQLPGCRGILVMNKVWVSIPYRGRGIGKIVTEFAQAWTKLDQCSVLMCTVEATNKRQLHLLDTLGWQPSLAFRNRRTTHDVLVLVRVV